MDKFKSSYWFLLIFLLIGCGSNERIATFETRDWNWFFSTIPQTFGAIVAIFMAFITTFAFRLEDSKTQLMNEINDVLIKINNYVFTYADLRKACGKDLSQYFVDYSLFVTKFAEISNEEKTVIQEILNPDSESELYKSFPNSNTLQNTKSVLIHVDEKLNLLEQKITSIDFKHFDKHIFEKVGHPNHLLEFQSFFGNYKNKFETQTNRINKLHVQGKDFINKCETLKKKINSQNRKVYITRIHLFIILLLYSLGIAYPLLTLPIFTEPNFFKFLNPIWSTKILLSSTNGLFVLILTLIFVFYIYFLWKEISSHKFIEINELKDSIDSGIEKANKTIDSIIELKGENQNV